MRRENQGHFAASSVRYLVALSLLAAVACAVPAFNGGDRNADGGSAGDTAGSGGDAQGGSSGGGSAGRGGSAGSDIGGSDAGGSDVGGSGEAGGSAGSSGDAGSGTGGSAGLGGTGASGGTGGTAGMGGSGGTAGSGTGGAGGSNGGSAGTGGTSGTGGMSGTGGTGGACPDRDMDELCDEDDKCPDFPNQTDASDFDNDGTPDQCDLCGPGLQVAQGPVAYYRLGDASGGLVNSVPGLEAGTYQSGMKRGALGVSEDGNAAAYFPGVDTTSSLSVTTTKFPTTALTIAFWVNLDNAYTSSLYSYASSADPNEFTLLYQSGALRVFRGDVPNDFVTTVAIPPNEWHHLAVTWNVGTGLLELYLDGALATSAVRQAGKALPASGILMLGQDQDSLGGGLDATQALSGFLDEFFVYDRVLSASEIAAHAQATSCKPQCETWYGTDRRCPAVHCKDLHEQRPAAPSGSYVIDPDGANATLGPMRASCDMTTDSGGWTLALNYLHAATTNPPVSALSDRLPIEVGSTLGSDESIYPVAWGHAAPSLVSALNPSEIRWYGRTTGHARVLHFKTHAAQLLTYLKTGTGNVGAPGTGVFDPSNTTKLAGHTAFLPLDATSNEQVWTDRGDLAFTEYPFLAQSNAAWILWGIGAETNRWSMDDAPGDESESTLHRAWLR